MRHIKPYSTNVNNSSLDLAISESISVLNRTEYMIPIDMRIDLDLKAFLSLDPMELMEHHKAFLRGNSMILTEALGSFSKRQIDHLNESIKELKEALRGISINESDESLEGNGEDINNVLDNIESNTDLSGIDPSKQGGVLKVLKDLLYNLTEEGEPIGILHFVLDIIGLLGDAVMAATGIPVGVIADLLNGIIYMVRAVNGDSSKYLLAIISFIAAIIPFGGDVFKGMIKGSKAGKEVMEIGTSYFGKGATRTGSAKVSDDAIKLVSEASPKSIEALEYIGKSSGTMLSGLREMSAKIFDGILSTLVGWIPFIGKPLKNFFNSIGKLIRGFSKDASKFADDIPKIIKEAELRQIDEFFNTAAGFKSEITKHGDKLIVKDRSGRIVELPASLLLRKNILRKRFGGTMSAHIDDLLKRSDKNIADFYESIAKNIKYANGIYGSSIKIGSKMFIPKRAWMIFLGKELIKLVNGPSGDVLNTSDSELESVGLGAFSRIAKNIQKKEMSKSKDIIYTIPNFNDKLDDNESHKIINDALDRQAKIFGLPRIESISYYTSGEKDKWPEGLKEFMEAGIDPEDESFKKMEDSLGGKSKDKKFKRLKDIKRVQESKKLTHLIPFSKFIKSI